MGKTTKIDWCDSTWNPATGCLHGCEYCYAKRIAERFGGCPSDGKLHEYDSIQKISYLRDDGTWSQWQKCIYPFSFAPTLHRYRLDEPRRWKEPRNIFVCSMAELFGEWVPDAWIDDVIRATQKALQHRYLFLTKNPERYGEWLERFETGGIDGLDEVANCWFGASASSNAELERANRSMATWISIEPIREQIGTDEGQFMEFEPYTAIERRRWDWVVVGAETGNSKSKVIPEKEWIDKIVDVCKFYGTPVFMKESLRKLMGSEFRQEFP